MLRSEFLISSVPPDTAATTTVGTPQPSTTTISMTNPTLGPTITTSQSPSTFGPVTTSMSTTTRSTTTSVNAGAIAGGAVGGVVLLGAIVAFVWYTRREKHRPGSTRSAVEQFSDSRATYRPPVSPRGKNNDRYGQAGAREIELNQYPENIPDPDMASGRVMTNS